MGSAQSTAAAQRERGIVLGICLLAAVHVLVYSATFPFFNPVDEEMHFDLVVRYAHADAPRALVPMSPESVPYLVTFGTFEYLNPPSAWPGGKVEPPPWTQSKDRLEEMYSGRAATWRSVPNHEASQPPLYYILAGGWWRAAQRLGLQGGVLLYSLRFVNALAVGVLTLLGWLTARRTFPANTFVRLAVPSLVAAMPQTAFYSINNDLLSSLSFGTVFLLLLEIWRAERLSPRLACLTGLALAATYLTKVSNLPLLAIAFLFLGLKLVRVGRSGGVRRWTAPLALLALTAAVPIAGWATWCKIAFGDLTGSSLKIRYLGWTDRPFVDWIQHPIFSPKGFWTFLSGNVATLWQGEFVWHREPLVLPGMNGFLVVLTIAALAVAGFSSVRGTRRFSGPQRIALTLGFAQLTALLAFFALLSVKYDFQHCFYPSREHPYFTSGRLWLGALVPFLLLFAVGMDVATERLGRLRWAGLGLLLLILLGSEVATNWRIFGNEYNWFHLIRTGAGARPVPEPSGYSALRDREFVPAEQRVDSIPGDAERLRARRRGRWSSPGRDQEQGVGFGLAEPSLLRPFVSVKGRVRHARDPIGRWNDRAGPSVRTQPPAQITCKAVRTSRGRDFENATPATERAATRDAAAPPRRGRPRRPPRPTGFRRRRASGS